jgi:adenylate cyclase
MHERFSPGATHVPQPDLAALTERIIERGLSGGSVPDQLRAFCADLDGAGLPIRRANLSINTLHPRYGAHSFIWHAGEDAVKHLPRTRQIWREEMFTRSPVYYLRRIGETMLRRRLDGIGPLQFPVLADLRAEGMTDYFGCLVTDGLLGSVHTAAASPQLDGLYFSVATDAPDGFDDGL